MRILIVDDDEDRHAGFRKMLSHHDRVHVMNPREAFKAISAITPENKFDGMFLDHDLGELQNPQYTTDGYGYGGMRMLDGNDVAQRVAELPANLRPFYVMIHSWNPEGAKRMRETLQGKVKNLQVKRYAPDFLPAGWGL